MENGYLKLGRLRGVPIRVHWSVAGLFLFLFMVNGFRFTPVAWAALLFLILIHEMGHAVLVRAFGLGLSSIEIKGFGGLCNWYGSPTPIQRSIIAWGGVLAQAVVLVIALPINYVVVQPGAPWWLFELMSALIYSNLYLMAFNLLPMPGFDGVEAWKLFGKTGLSAWWRQRGVKKRRQQDVIRPMPAFRRFSPDDILEKTPTDQKRPPRDMLN